MKRNMKFSINSNDVDVITMIENVKLIYSVLTTKVPMEKRAL